MARYIEEVTCISQSTFKRLDLKLVYSNNEVLGYSGYNEGWVYAVKNKVSKLIHLYKSEDAFRKAITVQGVIKRMIEEQENYKLSELDLCTLLSTAYYFSTCASGIRSSLARWLTCNKNSTTRYYCRNSDEKFIRRVGICWLSSSGFIIDFSSDSGSIYSTGMTMVSRMAYINGKLMTEGVYDGIGLQLEHTSIHKIYKLLEFEDLEVPELHCMRKLFGTHDHSKISDLYDVSFFAKDEN